MYLYLILLTNILKPLEYLDPGSGSIIVQLVIAAILGLGVFVRSQWARIKKIFGMKPAENDDDDNKDNNDG